MPFQFTPEEFQAIQDDFLNAWPSYPYTFLSLPAQDEKMNRVVLDRERWFNTVIGDKISSETEVTEPLAERILLPTQLVEDLSCDLSVVKTKSF